MRVYSDNILRNIPNAISILRIALVVLFAFVFLRGLFLPAIIIYIVASLSDILDGHLARKYNWVTELGKVLDPAADKMMLITVLICLCIRNMLPLWLIAPVLIKDTIMITVGIVFYKRKVEIEADTYGKITTWLFTIGIILTLSANYIAFLHEYRIDLLAMCTALAYSLFTFVHYALKFVGEQTTAPR